MDPGARLGTGVQVGPFAVIESETVIGDRTQIGGHAQVLKQSSIGSDCRIYHGAILGGDPQDIELEEEGAGLTISDRCTIREYVTINRGTKAPGTRVDPDVYLMAYAHIGHDSLIGANVMLANSVQVGGHVQIDPYAAVGGATPVHQFCHIGTHAFVGGGYRVVQDIPPYVLASGEPLRYVGINSIGLRRRGFSQGVRTQLKQVYRRIYRSNQNLRQAVEGIKTDFGSSPEVETVLAFIGNSGRGLI